MKMGLSFLRNSIKILRSSRRIPVDHPGTHVVNSFLVPSTLPRSRKMSAGSKPRSIPEFQFQEYINKKFNQINKALDQAVPIRYPTTLHDAMRYSLLSPSKRIASTLCIASFELIAEGKDESLVMPTACALEMTTTLAVILDDLPCMDNDDLRRGKPSNHKIYGEATSVLASQSLLCLAIEHISTKTRSVSPNVLVRVIAEISSALGSKGAAAGQFVDISSVGKEVNLRELEFIHRHKTGKFAEAAVVCGCLLGGGNEIEIERVRKYGKCVGLAHQVQDDVLDEIGSAETMGKKVGKDRSIGKATYPKLMGMEETKKYAAELVNQAYEELDYFDSDKAAPLYHIANFIISRRH